MPGGSVWPSFPPPGLVEGMGFRRPWIRLGQCAEREAWWAQGWHIWGPWNIPNLQQMRENKAASSFTSKMGLLGNGTGIGIQDKQAMAKAQASLGNSARCQGLLRMDVPRRKAGAQGAGSFSG